MEIDFTSLHSTSADFRTSRVCECMSFCEGKGAQKDSYSLYHLFIFVGLEMMKYIFMEFSCSKIL